MAQYKITLEQGTIQPNFKLVVRDTNSDYVKSVIGQVSISLLSNEMRFYLNGVLMYIYALSEIVDVNGGDTSNYTEEDFYSLFISIL